MQKFNDEETRWDWMPASQMIQTHFNGEIKFLDLAPQIVITHPDGEQNPDPVVKLYIDTEKSLQYTEEQGWNWHKSWNLPNISVRLEIKDSQTGDLLIAPKNIFAQLYAVKAVLENPQNFYLVDVGLRGVSKMELVDGQAFFTALRFASTSFNNDGVKFHLLSCIYIQESDSTIPVVLNTTISPPIFVDSRKTAKHQNEVQICSFVDPFPLDTFEREFIKRENKRKSDHDIKIENDVEGLLNYLTAPNIRHKVKHPLFLALKFSNCFKLYYNTQNSQTLNMQQIIEKLQMVMIRDYPLKNQDEKSFLIECDECDDPSKSKKLQESIEYLKFSQLCIRKNQEPIAMGYERINPEELIETYRQGYENIVIFTKQLKLKYMGECESQDFSDDQSESLDGQPVKKIKIQEISSPLLLKVEKISEPQKPKQDTAEPLNQQNIQIFQQKLLQNSLQNNQKIIKSPPQQILPSQNIPPVIPSTPSFQRVNQIQKLQLDNDKIQDPFQIPMSQIQQQPQLLQQLPYFQQMMQAQQLQQQQQLHQQQLLQQQQQQNPQINQLYLQQQLLLQHELSMMNNATNPMMMYQQYLNNPQMMMQNQNMMNNPMLQQQMMMQQHFLRQQLQFNAMNQPKPNIKDENK